MSKKSKNIVLPALTTLLGRVPGVGRFLRNYSDTKAALEVANTTISSQATTIEQLAQDAIRLANDEDHWRRVATNAGTQYDVALSYLVTREANLRAKANKQTPQPVIITDLAMPPHVKLNRINHSSVNNSGAHWYVNKDGSLLDIVDPSQAKAFEAFLERVQVGLANCETHYAEEGQFLLLPLTRSSGISEITGRVKKPRNYVVKVTAYNVPPPELFRKLEDIAQEKRAQEGDTQNTGVPLARQTPSCIGVITIYDPKVTK